MAGIFDPKIFQNEFAGTVKAKLFQVQAVRVGGWIGKPERKRKPTLWDKTLTPKVWKEIQAELLREATQLEARASETKSPSRRKQIAATVNAIREAAYVENHEAQRRLSTLIQAALSATSILDMMREAELARGLAQAIIEQDEEETEMLLLLS